MTNKTDMIHVRVSEEIKAEATAVLANVGLNVSDAVRIFLTRVVREGGLPVGLTADPEIYDAWFRDKVLEALVNDKPKVPHKEVVARLRARL